MKKINSTLLLTVFICFTFQGCTYKAWYDGFQEGQRMECNRYESSNERQECLERVNNMTYEEYKEVREDSISR